LNMRGTASFYKLNLSNEILYPKACFNSHISLLLFFYEQLQVKVIQILNQDHNQRNQKLKDYYF